MNKMGYNSKASNDTILYIVLTVMLLFFIFNMGEIYQFVSKVKTGEIFEEKKEQTEKPKDPVKEEKYEIVTPVGEDYGTCTKITNKENGDLTSIVKLYHTDYKLKSIVEEIEYVGINDEYINYIYSENNKFKERQDANKKLEGYSVVPTLSSSSTLKVSSIFNLKLVSLDKIKLKEDETLNLYGKYNQDTVEVTQSYVDLGYECEW